MKLLLCAGIHKIAYANITVYPKINSHDVYN